MRGVLVVIGWLLLGGVLGYATERWKVVYLLMIGLLGLSLIFDPSPPALLGVSDDGVGSWPETIGFVVGLISGGFMARKERAEA